MRTQFGPPRQLLSAIGNNVLSVLRKISVNVPSEQASCKTTPRLHPHRSEIFVCPVVKKPFFSKDIKLNKKITTVIV